MHASGKSIADIAREFGVNEASVREALDKPRAALSRADVLEEIKRIAATAQGKYGDFASMHEGYGVLAEEVAELFDAVRMRQSDKRAKCIRDEALDVAAVALRIAEQAGRVTR